MRDRQTGGGERTAAPQHDIEIEHARGPALSARSAPELALDPPGLLALLKRIERGFDHRRRIGVAPQRGTDRRGVQHPRGREHLDVFVRQPLQRRANHLARPAEPRVPPVRAERDQIAVRQMSSQMRP